VLQFKLSEIISTPASTKFVRIPAGCLHFLWVIYIVMASPSFTIVNGIVSVIVTYSLFPSDGPWKKIQTVQPLIINVPLYMIHRGKNRVPLYMMDQPSLCLFLNSKSHNVKGSYMFAY
jgi:hypothetical protein